VLDAHLALKKSGGYPKTIDRLYDLKEKSRDADFLLVALLDYYIGEGPGEILAQFITEKGKVMVPLLIAKEKKPLECLSLYKSICADSLEDRNEQIDQMLDAIRKGIILRVEDGT
jgi:hypothetical protein